MVGTKNELHLNNNPRLKKKTVRRVCLLRGLQKKLEIMTLVLCFVSLQFSITKVFSPSLGSWEGAMKYCRNLSFVMLVETPLQNEHWIKRLEFPPKRWSYWSCVLFPWYQNEKEQTFHGLAIRELRISAFIEGYLGVGSGASLLGANGQSSFASWTFLNEKRQSNTCQSLVLRV